MNIIDYLQFLECLLKLNAINVKLAQVWHINIHVIRALFKITTDSKSRCYLDISKHIPLF